MALRLIYFAGRARAEISRLILAFGALDYTDVRLSDEEFEALKPKLPTGQLPVLDLDGVYVPQSKAIESYLARITGLYPTDPLDALVCDVVRENWAEAYVKAYKTITAELAKRAAAIASFKATDLPIALQRFEKVLMENDGGAGWFVGSGVTVADLTVFQYCDYVVTLVAPDCLVGFDVLALHFKRVGAIPTIRNYVETRPADEW